MTWNPNDYDNDTQRATALVNRWKNGTSEVYLNRVKYDLERSCERRDHFIETAFYQTIDSVGWFDNDGYAGFEDYTPPIPQYRLFLNGSETIGIIETTGNNTYSPGTTVSITVVDDSSSDAIWSNGALVRLRGYPSNDYTGNHLFETSVSVTSNFVATTITIPSNISGDLYLNATPGANDVVINEIYLFDVNDPQGVDASTLISNFGVVQDYYNPSNVTEQFTITLTPVAGITLSDYRGSITIQEGETLNYFGYQTGITPLPSQLTFSLDQLSLYQAGYNYSSSIRVLIGPVFEI
jgi:hypothetical protein